MTVNGAVQTTQSSRLLPSRPVQPITSVPPSPTRSQTSRSSPQHKAAVPSQSSSPTHEPSRSASPSQSSQAGQSSSPIRAAQPSQSPTLNVAAQPSRLPSPSRSSQPSGSPKSPGSGFREGNSSGVKDRDKDIPMTRLSQPKAKKESSGNKTKRKGEAAESKDPTKLFLVANTQDSEV